MSERRDTMGVVAAALAAVGVLVVALGRAGPAGGSTLGEPSTAPPVVKARVSPTPTPRLAAPAGPATMQMPVMPIRVRASQPLTMTGLGDRPIASPTPAPPIVVRAGQTLTMTGLGDRPIATPTAAPPIRIRAAETLTMTGVY